MEKGFDLIGVEEEFIAKRACTMLDARILHEKLR
jgi:hypothetical protein